MTEIAFYFEAGVRWHLGKFSFQHFITHFKTSNSQLIKPQLLRKFWDFTPNGANFSCDQLNFPMKFVVKFTTLFPSSQFDWQLRNEIAKFIANVGNFKRTSETVCQKFSETHCKNKKNLTNWRIVYRNFVQN